MLSLRPAYILRNPLLILATIAFVSTTLIVLYVDGGFRDDSLVQVQPATAALRSIIDLGHAPSPPEDDGSIDWKNDFAYVQYATTQDYLCNALMIFDQLESLKTRPDRVLIYPNHWGVPDEEEPTLPQGLKRVKKNPVTTKLLRLARDKYHVRLDPVSELRYQATESTWRSSFTKIMAFNLTQYKRVLVLDSDAFVLKSLDDLFLRKHTFAKPPLAAPLAYWEPADGLDIMVTSGFMLIDPSNESYEKVLAASQTRPEFDYDMEVINNVFGGEIEILPHRGLSMLTAEYRETKHDAYLGPNVEWDGKKELENLAYLHFSDWPFPKVSDSL